MRPNNLNVFESKPPQKKLWKRSFFYFCIALALALLTGILALGGYLIYFYNFKTFPPPPEVSHIRPHLQHGDIILRSGIGFWSERFRNSNPADKRFSHVGIVLIDEPGKYLVLHAEGDDLSGDGTVAIITLEQFVGGSVEIGISRLHTLSPAEFVRNAKKYLGRPFDWKFDTASDTDIYCTELVDLALKPLSPDMALKRNRQNIIVPEACLDKRFFTEILLPPAPSGQAEQ